MKAPKSVLYLQERKRYLFLLKRTMPTLEITEVTKLQSGQESSSDIKKPASIIGAIKMYIPHRVLLSTLPVVGF